MFKLSRSPRRNLFRPALLGAALGAVLLQAELAQSQWRGQEAVEKGVVIVQNPAKPMSEPSTLELEELWRLGGDSEEPGEFFGLISDIAVEPSGEVYLLDRQLSEVKVFSGEGEYLRTIGREGEGPGEFRRPGSLFFMPDGNLAVVQTRPSALILLTPEGDPLEPFPMRNPDDGGFSMVFSGAFRGGSLVLLGGNFRRGQASFDRTTALVRMDMNGNEIARLHSMTNSSSMANMVIRETESFGLPWTVGPDGSVVASLDSDYRIHLWSADGTLEREIRLEYPPRMRSKDEKEKRKQELERGIRIRGPRGSRPTITTEVSDKDRDIQWLAVSEDGSLWVLSSRGALESPAGSIGRFEIYDRKGRYLQDVTLMGDADFEEDRLVLAGDRFFVIKQYAAAARAMRGTEVEDDALEEDEPEPMSVICYRFDWTPSRAVAAPSN